MPPPSLATVNPFALLQDNDNNDVDSPTTIAAFVALDNDVNDATNGPTSAVSLSVLNHKTGKFLEHRQLCREPKHKPTWDRS